MDRFVTLLTPRGRGAVATVAVGGHGGLSCVAARFAAARGRPLDELPVGRIYFGRWRASDGAGEELVVSRRSGWVELHCHGGIAASDAIVQDLVQDGCREVSWAEFVWRTAPDPLTAEACVALAHARTDRTAAILMDQWRGALRDAWRQMESAIEAQQRTLAIACLQRLLSRSRVGTHLIEPYRVVLCGPPNVGKSTLINALLGYHRSIVFDQPGTTRDVLTAYTALEGWPVELSDTAGLRDEARGIEAEGIDRSRRQIERADLVIYVADSAEPCPPTAVSHAPDTRRLLVQNKVDLGTAQLDGADILTSAVTGAGIAELAQAIAQRLVPQPPLPGQAVPFTVRQIDALQAIQQVLLADKLTEAIAISRTARCGEKQVSD
jgi:tRNA modification GTPase